MVSKVRAKPKMPLRWPMRGTLMAPTFWTLSLFSNYNDILAFLNVLGVLWTRIFTLVNPTA